MMLMVPTRKNDLKRRENNNSKQTTINAMKEKSKTNKQRGGNLGGNILWEKFNVNRLRVTPKSWLD